MATTMTAPAATSNGVPASAKPGEPLWWLTQLESRLRQRQGGMNELANWYEGNHPLPFLTPAHQSKLRDQFRRLLDESRSNFMRLVVDATEERLAVDGFRLSAETDAVSDRASWEIWQANQMDAQSQTAILEALVKGVSYLSVWADDDKDGYPDIAVEDPLQTIVAYGAGSHYRKRVAAAKIWLDEFSGERRANLYLPDGIYKFKATDSVAAGGYTPSPQQQSLVSWVNIEDGFVRNPLGVVPIIPLRNRPRLLVEGESELSDITTIQSQINGFLFLLALAGYMGAHKQKYVTGMALMEDKDGTLLEPFKMAIDQLLQAEDPNAKFGEFAQTDLGGYIAAIEQKVLHMAVVTRTPRHYLIQQGQSPSGDAIKSAESGLVRKVMRKQRTFGEGLEEAIRLARRFGGETKTPPDSEIVWADPEQRAFGAVTDAVVKQYVARLITLPIALEKIGYSQVEIRQIQNAPDSEFCDLEAKVQKSLGQHDLTAGTGVPSRES